MNLPEKVYTETDVTRAKATSRVIGWLQGGAAVLAGAILWNLMGWIPVVVGVVAGGWLLTKLLSRSKKEGEEQEDD